MNARTMTLNLSSTEMDLLQTLCEKKGMNKTSLIKQALRVYQAVETRLERGEKLFFEDSEKKEKSELVLL